MSYTTGTANTTTALRAAIFAACAADGWTVASPVMSKGSLAMQIDLNTVSTAQGLKFRGGKSVSAGALVGGCPNFVSMGDRTNLAFTFPLTYHILSFASPDEVYVVVNYDVDRYQWAAWGRSALTLPGTGMWFASVMAGSAGQPDTYIEARNSGSAGSYTYTQPGPFWRNGAAEGFDSSYLASQMHHGLDGDIWNDGALNNAGPYCASSANPLFSLLPNAWNGEAVLLPMLGLIKRPSNFTALVCTPRNARYLRIDNHSPGEIITLGADRWIAFPWLRKDASRRNGTGGAIVADLHTGTMGWAIRYEGP